MSDDKPTTRRDLMRPVQLLGMAFGSAVIAGVITAFSLGIATNPTKPGMSHAAAEQLRQQIVSNAWTMSLVMAGIVFIAVLLLLSLMLLAVKPKDFEGSVDRPVLLPDGVDFPKADGTTGANGSTRS